MDTLSRAYEDATILKLSEHTMRLLLGAAAGVACAYGLAAQADILYTNISSTAGEYHDCITLWNGVANRPLAQESNPNNPRKATDSVRKMRHRVVGGKSYLYWHDIIPDQILRATDSNFNGVLDPAEFETLYSYGGGSDGSLDEHQGVWWGCLGAASVLTQYGLWKFTDLTNDGDFLDAGEATQMAKPPSITATGGYTVSVGNPTACAVLPSGDCIWFERLSAVWYRTTPAGVHSVWLVYRTPTGGITPAPLPNPDFGTTLPAIPTDWFDRAAVDPATGTVYLAPNFSQSAGVNYVYRCRDLNVDGDVNDAGEINVFYNGVTSSPKWGPIDDIDWLQGAVYLSYEIDPALDPGSQFVRLQDLNADGDAMDAGELSSLGRTASTDDPTEIGVIAVPAGTFGSSCVNVDLRSSQAITSTAAGSVTFTLGDIPTSRWNENTRGYLLLSLTGAAPVPLPIAPFGCIVGITIDPMLTATLGAFFGGPITGATQAIGTLPYPAGIPIGTKLYFSSFLLRMSDFNLRGASQTGILEVRT